MADQVAVAQEAFRAFAHRDYEKCTHIVGQVFPRTTVFLMQLMLISLQRTGNDRLVRLFTEEHLPHLKQYEWEYALVRLTLGDIDPTPVAELARNSEMRVEYHCYLGSRLLTLGKVESAKEELIRCLEIEGTQVEKNLAYVQLSWADDATAPGPATAVRDGSVAFGNLHSEGRFVEAREIAKATYELARSKLPESDLNRLVVTNNFAVAELDLGNVAQAEVLCQEGLALIRAGDIRDDYPISVTYNLLAQSQRRQGRQEEAVNSLDSALLFRRKARGSEHPDLISLYGFKGEILRESGDSSRAKAAFEAALQICEGRLSASDGRALHIRSVFADLLAEGGDLERAEAILRECVVEEPTSLDQIKAHTQLAHILDANGKPIQAQALYRSVLVEIERRFGAAHEHYCTCLHQYARSLMRSGEVPAAIAALSQAIELFGIHGGGRDLRYARILRDKAAGLCQCGRAKEAVSIAEEAFAIQTKILTSIDPELTASSQLLGRIYLESGAFSSALPHLRHVVDRLREEQGELTVGYAVALTRLGRTLTELHKHKEAVTLFRRALEINQELGQGETLNAVRIRSGLAVALEGAGERAEAETCLNDALELHSRVGQPSDPDRLALIHNLSNLRGPTIDDPQDDSYLNELRNATRDRSVVTDGFLDSLIAVGRMLWARGDFDGAATELRAAIEAGAFVWPTLSPSRIRALEALACARAATGQFREAIGLLTEAESERDGLIAQIFTTSSERERTNFLNEAHASLGAFFTLLFEEGEVATGDVEALWQFIFRRKAAAVEAMALQRRAIYSTAVDDEARLELLALRRSRAAMDLVGPTTKGEENDHFVEIYEKTRNRIERLEELVAQQGGNDFSLGLKVSAAEIRGSLPRDAALIEYAKFRTFSFRSGKGEPKERTERYAAFLIQADTTPRLIDLGAASSVDLLVRTFREVNTPENIAPVQHHSHDVDTDPDPSTELFRTLAAPLLSLLGPTICRLFIVPDGSISWLPLATLRNEQGAALIDKFTMCYLTSSRDLCTSVAERPEPSRSIVVGNPDFEFGRTSRSRVEHSDPGQLFPPLPGTLLEANLVARILQVEPWVAASVLKTRLLEAHSPRVLHFGTHGFFLENSTAEWTERSGLTFYIAGEHTIGGRLVGPRITSPLLRSGLALAGANTWLSFETPPPEAGNGLLTAEDGSSRD